MLGQVAAVDGLYYSRIVRTHPLAQSDLVVFGLPILGAFALHAAVLGAWSTGQRARARADRLLVAAGLTVLGFFMAMFIALNKWGS
jgi:hypothetical protein